MEKRREFLLVASLIFVMAVALLPVFILQNRGITGFTIYESQPGAEGKDTYIREDFPNNNFGANTGMQVGKTAGSSKLRSLVQFNISSLSDTDTITNGKMSLYVSAISGSNLTVLAYLVTADWTETGASWNNKSSAELWGSAGGDYAYLMDSVFINQSGWYNFTITSAAKGWKNGTYLNYGLILIAPNATTGNYIDVYSSDYGDATLAPKIIVDHTANAAPIISGISTDSSLSSPKQTGQSVSFTINWNDLEGNSAKALVCNSSDISFQLGCGDKTFCNTSVSASSPITCSYAVTTAENRSQNFWVAVCDSGNCSESNQSQFFMNHFPNVTVIQPNGGETVNQSIGNYTIKFNETDLDNDEIKFSVYYSDAPNSAQYLIVQNLSSSLSCTNADNNNATPNNCTYSWNSLGIHGEYYLTIIANDSYSSANSSSNSSFFVRSINDILAPGISSQGTDSYINSGRITQIYANISDANAITAWAAFNYSQPNITLSNSTSVTFNATFIAPAAGNYKFKVYARDIIGNLNDSMPWQEFSVVKPNASSEPLSAPSTSLPYHIIKVSSALNAADSIREVYAYLNTNPDFTFLSGYSQNLLLGNFSAQERKTAAWFLSVPITESTYSLNVTYSDFYSNSWNSSNAQVVVTSSVGGGYLLTVSGYPEVETAHNYLAESNFLSGSAYLNPDSMTIRIYDSTGTAVLGPVSMNQKETGKYNYSYAIGSSVNEGLWETRVNATKSGTSYYANQFFNIVGGPFDIRSITVDNSQISALAISVTAENTGGANKDLTLIWNLTRVDTDTVLDSGSDTIRVNASSTKIWTVYPSTSYIGPVKITFLGYYSGTEKAGAYKLFSTTSGTSNVTCGDGTCSTGESCSTCPSDCGTCPVTPPGGGGGGGGGANPVKENKTANFEIIAEPEVYLTKNLAKTIELLVNNTGQVALTNISLTLKGLNESSYSLSPSSILSLPAGKTQKFEIKFFITGLSGEQYFYYTVQTNELTKKEPGRITVMSIKDFFNEEVQRLRLRLNKTQESINKGSKDKIQSLTKQLESCENIVLMAESDVKNESFINADIDIKAADSCINSVESRIESTNGLAFNIPENLNWIITWILIIILILALIFIAYLIYKRMTLASFLNSESKEGKKNTGLREEYINKKIADIEKKIQPDNQEDETEM